MNERSFFDRELLNLMEAVDIFSLSIL